MHRSRKQVKALKVAVRNDDAEAARLLLAHSVALGHPRLSVRRYFVARALGADGLGPFRQLSQAAARRMLPDVVLGLAQDVARHVAQHKGPHPMASELLSASMPFMLPYEGTEPHFATEPRFCGAGSSVLGKVKIGARATLAPASVIRADGHYVRIGDDFRLGENSTVHIAHEVYPTIIGDRVTVERNAVVHACTVGNDCVIEDGVVILDGSVVKDRVLIEAGSTIYPRSTLRAGFVYAGNPAEQTRELTNSERSEREARMHRAIADSIFSTMPDASYVARDVTRDVFIARTACLTGHVNLLAKSSVFFSCLLNAVRGSIIVCDNSNIQDNTRIQCFTEGVIIGRDTTIGHNVVIHDCRIGERSLVGIGSVVSPGTIIEDDVLRAAGSATDQGQRLEGGWLWGGRPAQPIAKLDDAKRTMMRAIIEQYCGYGATYRQLQSRLVR
jgi:carbonic anhydrase/acetyltransferase-like protein (isoleucine patch superfamily)